MSESRIEHHDGGTSFVGEKAVNIFALMTLKHGIALYAQTGMRPSRAYTPTAMKAAAERATGKKYNRGDWHTMVHDLDVVIRAKRSAIPEIVT